MTERAGKPKEMIVRLTPDSSRKLRVLGALEGKSPADIVQEMVDLALSHREIALGITIEGFAMRSLAERAGLSRAGNREVITDYRGTPENPD